MKPFLVVLGTASLMCAGSWAANEIPGFEELKQMNGFQKDPSLDLEPFVSMRAQPYEPSKPHESLLPHAVDSMVFTLDTGAKREEEKQKKKRDGITMVEKAITGLFNHPAFRSSSNYTFKPKIFRANNGQNSMKVELTASTVMQAIKDLLKSSQVREYTDIVARKAALFYRTLQHEIGQEKKPKSKGFSRINK